MKQSPTRCNILSAECRLMQTKSELREHFAQIRSAVHSRLTRPSSLLVVVGLGTLLGAWFARRNRARAVPESIAASVPLSGLVTPFLYRFGMQRLTDAWARLRSSDSTRDSRSSSADG